MHSIYIIQNKINNKIYIGKAIDYPKRIKKHLRDAKKDPRHLYQAIRKYDWNNFISFIIEDVDDSNINEAEKFWIEYFRSWDREYGYNLTFGGDGSVPSIETREKMRQAKLGKPNPKMQGANHPLFGIKGEEHHRYGTSHTLEALEKISKASLNREHSKGSDRYNSLITEEDVLYMREYFSSNASITSKKIFAYLANKFSISPGTVENIIYNLSWKHVKSFHIKNKNCKLQEQDIRDIRSELNEPNIKKVVKRQELANKYGVSAHTIYEIETNRKWKHVI